MPYGFEVKRRYAVSYVKTRGYALREIYYSLLPGRGIIDKKCARTYNSFGC